MMHRHHYWHQYVVSVVLSSDPAMNNVQLCTGSYSDPAPYHTHPQICHVALC